MTINYGRLVALNVMLCLVHDSRLALVPDFFFVVILLSIESCTINYTAKPFALVLVSYI
jgi:hypothetical protein